MDWLGYKGFWDDDGNLPKRRIVARQMRYDMGLGCHPYGMNPDSLLFDAAPFPRAEGNRKVHDQWQMDPRGTVDGHTLMRDDTLPSLLEVDPEVPLSPLFVKDLAGRVIYIGYGPERKGLEEWDAYGAARLDENGSPENPWLPLVTFPRRCHDVDGVMEGAELLEQVFLTKFRTLDMGRDYVGRPSGAPEDVRVQGVYGGANLYPYKYRLDTFYTDGWKLPQTQMLYARQDADGTAARQAGEEIRAAWQGRAAGMRYETWLEQQGDESYVEALYAKGCTLIPTFEACNGLNVVGREFQLEEFWPGRSVTGLHDEVERRADKAPAGTILEVVEPGYVTAHMVVPAKVVVSDGSGYVSPNVADPLPLIPNLHLPHSRTLPNWKATWIPTHPEHFEKPALWGWDVVTGRFLQMFGPLWDPLHYWYESVPLVYDAIKTPLDDNRWLARVPENMKERFYPVTERKGFDVVSFEALERRKGRGSPPMSAVTRVPGQAVSADIGYHPLPLEFEYELDTFWFPEFHPRHRGQGACPEEMMARMCPVIEPKVSVEAYVRAIPEQPEVPWLTDKTLLAEPHVKALDNYPHLARYLIAELTPEEIADLVPLPYLGHLDDDMVVMTAQQLWAGYDGFDTLESLESGTYDAVWDYRESAKDVLRFRHMVYQMSPGLYKLAWWSGALPDELQEMFAEWHVNTRLDELKAGEGAGEAVREAPVPTPAGSGVEEGGKQPMTIPRMAVEEGFLDE